MGHKHCPAALSGLACSGGCQLKRCEDIPAAWGSSNLPTSSDCSLCCPLTYGFPDSSGGREYTHECRRPQFNSWVRKIYWRREWLPTPVFWPAEFLDYIVHGVIKSWTRLSDFHILNIYFLELEVWSQLSLVFLYSFSMQMQVLFYSGKVPWLRVLNIGSLLSLCFHSSISPVICTLNYSQNPFTLSKYIEIHKEFLFMCT